MEMDKGKYKLLREERGTQEDVAVWLGIDRSTIVRREAGDIEISREAELALLSIEPASVRCDKCQRIITEERINFYWRRDKSGTRIKSVSGHCRDCSNGDGHVTRHRKKFGVNLSFPYEAWGKKLDGCGGICPACGEKKQLTIDHVKAFSLGGGLEIENLSPLCGPCNTRKQNKS